MQKAIDKAIKTVNDDTINIPDDLAQSIKKKLGDDPTQSWDEAIVDLVMPSSQSGLVNGEASSS